MPWRPPAAPCGWRWRLFSACFFFLGFVLAKAAAHGAGAGAPATAAPAPRLHPAEARVLRPIAAKLGMTHWDWAAGPCGPAGGVDCQCSNYYSNQTVICHVVRMYVIKRGFSKLADDPIQGCAVMPVVQWVTQQIALIVFAESSRAATSPASFRPTAPTSHICNISVTPSVSRCLLNLTTPKQQIRASNLR
ncbi:uncharacterized protein LOC112879743 [Panicum hallii]|uniref:uncharacterized protein LOC112879743 n=1 Tax=Panicum hallii TaxID=206008 RepID=UPI000DF4ECF1|nr:uncharacterized protein LOC112879743 [Panicum hallii]